MKEIGVGEIGLIIGRYYAMDRDNRWDRVELAYKALTQGEGVKGQMLRQLFRLPMTDERPMSSYFRLLSRKTASRLQLVQDKDSVIFFNFRPDRAREITRAFCDDDFKGLREKRDWILLSYASQSTMIPSRIKK